MSRFSESLIGTDWHAQDIADSDERTKLKIGMAIMIVSAVVTVSGLAALVVWLAK